MFDHTLALQQLTQKSNPFGVLSVMIGARKFLKSDKDNFIQFHFSMCKKASICKLQYDAGQDLYNMIFTKVKRTRMIDPYLGRYFYNKTLETAQEFRSLQSDQLKDVFEEFTGLYLSI